MAASATTTELRPLGEASSRFRDMPRTRDRGDDVPLPRPLDQQGVFANADASLSFDECIELVFGVAASFRLPVTEWPYNAYPKPDDSKEFIKYLRDALPEIMNPTRRIHSHGPVANTWCRSRNLTDHEIVGLASQLALLTEDDVLFIMSYTAQVPFSLGTYINALLRNRIRGSGEVQRHLGPYYKRLHLALQKLPVIEVPARRWVIVRPGSPLEPLLRQCLGSPSPSLPNEPSVPTLHWWCPASFTMNFDYEFTGYLPNLVYEGRVHGHDVHLLSFHVEESEVLVPGTSSFSQDGLDTIQSMVDGRTIGRARGSRTSCPGPTTS